MTPLPFLLACALAGAALAHRRDLRERDGELAAALKGAEAYRMDLRRAQASEGQRRRELAETRANLLLHHEALVETTHDLLTAQRDRKREAQAGPPFRSWAEMLAERGEA